VGKEEGGRSLPEVRFGNRDLPKGQLLHRRRLRHLITRALWRDFDEIAKKFPRTSAGRFSLLYEGNIHLKMGEYEEAIKAYSAFMEKGPKEKLFRFFAMEGLVMPTEGRKNMRKPLRRTRRPLNWGRALSRRMLT